MTMRRMFLNGWKYDFRMIEVEVLRLLESNNNVLPRAELKDTITRKGYDGNSVELTLDLLVTQNKLASDECDYKNEQPATIRKVTP